MQGAAILCLLASAGFAVRHRRAASGGWSTVTDPSHGPCAEHIKHVADDFPVHIPLFCSQQATGLRVSANAYGIWNPSFHLVVNGKYMGNKKWPVFGGTRTWTVDIDDLPAGLHTVTYYGNVDLNNVTLSGSGGSCSFDTVPRASRDAASYTYSGLDVLNRLFGEDRNFSSFKKTQLDFASETIGKTDNGSISATVVGNGIWEWVYQYSQKQASNDPWLKKMQNGGKLWDESLMTPYPEISLGYMPRRSGQKMKVCEPCNTLSNLAFHEAAVWISCKGYPFTREEYASLTAAFNGLAAGSAFLHACACDTGDRADTFTMDWLMLQSYQIMIKQVVNGASSELTATEMKALQTFGTDIGQATDVARDLTRLFEGKYDHAHWNATVRGFDIPPYEMPIAGIICFVAFAVQGSIPIPGLDAQLQSILEGVMDIFGLPDKEWLTGTYIPAVKKVLGVKKLCGDAVFGALEYLLKFLLTFVEALVFQEQQLPAPDWLRDLAGWLDRLGLSSNLLSDMVVTWDYYNGFDCKDRSDHATWHEKASHGLVHTLKLAEIFTNSVCDA